MNEEILFVALTTGNYEDNSTIVPRVRVVASVIQYFVRERRHIRHQTVSKEMMNLLEVMGFIKIDRNFQRDVNAELRLVQHFLNHLG